MRRLSTAIVCLAALLPAASARADVFGSISLVSDSPTEQADYAQDPAISGDGRYIAFDGYFDGQTGVWRRDLQTGEIEPVAVGTPKTDSGSALLPSISDDGRYVSFTTLARLAPSNDANSGPDVYVRDMDVPEQQTCAEEQSLQPASPCAFTLASAASGERTGLQYEYGSGAGRENEEENLGSQASGRSALSADGQEVVFVTTARSNLDGPGTAALEVAVRHLDTGVTETASVEYDPATGAPAIGPGGTDEPVKAEQEGSKTFGAAYSLGSPPSFPQQVPYQQTAQVAASISADGSTVAWLGQDAAEQAPALAGESLPPKYSDVFWRRIADGEGAISRRVSGGLQGPFLSPTGEGLFSLEAADPVPRLSADGEQVAFIANAPLAARGEDFGLGTTQLPGDLYRAEMNTPAPAVTALTEFASGNTSSIAEDGSVVDDGISPDGSQVAFTTKRIAFPLGIPALVSTPATVPQMLELFDVDVDNETLTRVTSGYEGGASEHPHASGNSEDPYEEPGDGALSPSFSDDGETLAFSSTASNLVFGDGNSPPLGNPRFDGSDAFLVNRIVFAPTPAAQAISPPPPGPVIAPAWSLGVTANSLANGNVRLYVEAPEGGVLKAAASASVAVKVAGSSAANGKARRARTRVLSRNVASASRVADGSGEGLTELTLTLTRGYRALATRSGGLSATVTVTFSAPGHAPLRQKIQVLFRDKAKAAAKRAPKGRRR
jgi:WD40-like Beta Propeller Repeat